MYIADVTATSTKETTEPYILGYSFVRCQVVLSGGTGGSNKTLPQVSPNGNEEVLLHFSPLI
jgi:hypothetical protein